MDKLKVVPFDVFHGFYQKLNVPSKYDEQLMIPSSTERDEIADIGHSIPAYTGGVAGLTLARTYFKINNGDYVCVYAGEGKFYIQL